MTIPEQAVEEAKSALRGVFNYLDPEENKHTARAISSANSIVDDLVASLMGVQRPEDVARVKEAFEQQFPQYKRDGFTGGDRQDYETLKAALLALPHTGQPQEGAVAIAMWRKWALSLEPETDGPSEDWIGGFNEALDKIEEALSAAPTSPRAWKGAACQRQSNCQWPECDCPTSFSKHIDGALTSEGVMAWRRLNDAQVAAAAALSAAAPPPVAESGWQEIVERVAAIGLWRDYYPDGRDELAGGTLGGHGITPDDVRKARALVAEKRENR